MKRKMIFFDIDGTILDNKTGKIPESTKTAIRSARENGHLAFLCTGRCKAIWPQDILEIGFDGVVGGCGTHIFYQDEEVFHATIDQKLQQQIAKDILEMHIDGVLEGPVESYFRKDYWMDEVVRIFGENGIYSDSANLHIEDKSVYDFDKMALWHDETSDMKGFIKKYEDKFCFIERDKTFYEVVPKGCTKATGIQFLCDLLDIEKEDTVAFGDSTNDLTMLEYVGLSVAMGDGNPAIFDSVDYVTDAVMENGIFNAMKKFDIL